MKELIGALVRVFEFPFEPGIVKCLGIRMDIG